MPRLRANGEGSISKKCRPECGRNADGACVTHRGLWMVRMFDDGRRVARYVRTEREARAALKEAQRNKDAGRAVMPERRTMNQLFDAWLADLRGRVERGERSPNTLREYSSYVEQHLRPALGRVDCRRLSVRDVDRYLTGLPLAAKTRHNHRIALRRALNVAKRWGWVDDNPAALSEPIPVPRRDVAALTFEDARRLLDALRSDPLYPVFVTALFTGLRAGELAGLRIDDLDCDAAALRVRRQIQPAGRGSGVVERPLKTRASADRLDLMPEVLAVLADAIGERQEGYIFESAPGRPYWPTSLTHGLQRALRRAGLPSMRLHDLRHGFVSFLPQLDVHPAVAQRLARHARIGTTLDVYTAVEDGLKRQAMGRLHDAFQNATGVPTGVPEPKIITLRG